MWCDSFDADLLKVVPGVAEALGDTADLQLTTYSHVTDGRINCPSAWNTDFGLASFFWTAPEFRPPSAYCTTEPEVECTFLEVIRDEWVHSCAVVVNRHLVWRPPAGLLDKLMYDLRGWGGRLEDGRREEIRGHALRSLEAAAGRLRSVLGAPAADREASPPAVAGTSAGTG